MQRVIGIGGVFFKSRNPAEVIAWYEKHLGMKPTWDGGVVFEWKQADRPDRPGQTPELADRTLQRSASPICRVWLNPMAVLGLDPSASPVPLAK